MIKSKEDLKFYLAADKFSLEKENFTRPKLTDDVWKFQILLRKTEYYKNAQNNLKNKLLFRFFYYKKYKLGLKLGFDIPLNVFGAGLRINHYGNIVINCTAKIGMWCDIHQGVNVGENIAKDESSQVPTIGNNVWIGPGAKLFGSIHVGDNSIIAANAVVNKDVAISSTVAGVPSRVIKSEGTEQMQLAASVQRMNDFFNKYPEFAAYYPKQFLNQSEA